MLHKQTENPRATVTSTTRWVRLNGPVRESTRLPLVAVHSPRTPLICNTPSSFHGRCPTHITQTSPPAHTHASLNTHAHTTRTQYHTHAQHTVACRCHERPSTPRLVCLPAFFVTCCAHPLMYLTTRTRPAHTTPHTHTTHARLPNRTTPTTRRRQG
jgi:hypothetical protein